MRRGGGLEILCCFLPRTERTGFDKNRLFYTGYQYNENRKNNLKRNRQNAKQITNLEWIIHFLQLFTVIKFASAISVGTNNYKPPIRKRLGVKNFVKGSSRFVDYVLYEPISTATTATTKRCRESQFLLQSPNVAISWIMRKVSSTAPWENLQPFSRNHM